MIEFIAAKVYYDIYLIFLTIVTLMSYGRYKEYSLARLNTAPPYLWNRETFDRRLLLLVVPFILFIGLRPNSGVFVDMMNYFESYNRGEGDIFIFETNTQNLIWDNLFAWWTSNSLGFNNFMLLCSAINFGCTAWACHRLFPKDDVIAFLVFLGAFSTFSYATNGVKAGTAMAVFVLGLTYYKDWKMFVPLILASYGFHHSMQLPIAACIMAYFYRNTKVYLYVWGLCILIAAAHITLFQELFATISADTMDDAHGAAYLMVEKGEGYITGFRPDFILYSAAPVWIGWKAIFKKNIKSEFYSFFLNVYLITNSVWMLCMYASFTNRIAYLSWGLYPFVLIYPLLKENWGANQYKFFIKIVLFHLGFTLAMHYVYYVFLH